MLQRCTCEPHVHISFKNGAAVYTFIRILSLLTLVYRILFLCGSMSYAHTPLPQEVFLAWSIPTSSLTSELALIQKMRFFQIMGSIQEQGMAKGIFVKVCSGMVLKSRRNRGGGFERESIFLNLT